MYKAEAMTCWSYMILLSLINEVGSENVAMSVAYIQ